MSSYTLAANHKPHRIPSPLSALCCPICTFLSTTEHSVGTQQICAELINKVDGADIFYWTYVSVFLRKIEIFFLVGNSLDN